MFMRICPDCGTENEEEYSYCKNCGAKLEIAENKTEYQYNTGSTDSGTYNPNFAGAKFDGFFVDTISGIPSDEVCAFVGKKSPDILKKFSKMEVTGSKVSWCWPVAVLGFLFGPLGSAIWFFYRKMYKPALILVALGIAVNVAVASLTQNVQTDLPTKTYDEIIENYENDNFYDIDYKKIFEYLYGNIDAKTYIAYAIDGLTDVATLVITGLYAFYWYKKHMVNKINSYRSSGNDMRYYQFGLMSIGGTSGGAAALGIIVPIFAERIILHLISLI